MGGVMQPDRFASWLLAYDCINPPAPPHPGAPPAPKPPRPTYLPWCACFEVGPEACVKGEGAVGTQEGNLAVVITQDLLKGCGGGGGCGAG